MRILAIVAIVAALAWGGYWAVGARALNQSIDAGLARLPQVQVAGHSLQGFPNRFDVTFDEPRVALGALDWSSAFVQVFALSYRPNHLIAVFAPDQALRLGRAEMLLHSADLRASLVMAPSLTLPLDRFTLVGQQLELDLPGQTHRTDGLRAATRRLTDTEHEVVVLFEGLFPDTGLIDRMDPQRALPRRLDVFRVDGRVTTDRPVDRTLVGGPAPRVVAASVTGGRIAWEGVDVTASGDMVIDGAGHIQGTMTLRVTGWQALVAMGIRLGLIPAEQEGFVTLALQGLRVPDAPDQIEAPLVFENGEVRLGPLVLGRVPPLG